MYSIKTNIMYTLTQPNDTLPRKITEGEYKKLSAEDKSQYRPIAKRGFAVMPKDKQRQIASMGGKSSHGGGRKPKYSQTQL